MTYKKADLKAVKEKLAKSNKSFRKKPTRKIIKKEISKNYDSKKTVIQWNYNVNDIVICPYHDNQIGLIISDSHYFGKKVEKNYFFVLVGSRVIPLNGQHLRKVWRAI